MWKVMAADDEAYMQQALEKLIPWERLGCTLCRIAPDGRELVEQMELEHPDIVITDIRMPELDGLGVCKYVFEKCPEVQVIILSAYADFTYARTAIRYNACEYVLKTEVLEELPKALEKAMKALEKQKKEIQSQVFKGEDAGDFDSLYRRMVRFVEENYCKRITLDDMAEALHANRSYLSRLYKNTRGVNLFDDILRMRIEKAKDYMRTTEMKIYEISEAVGFEDTGYFSRVFKKYTGMSPKEFRGGKRDENMQE